MIQRFPKDQVEHFAEEFIEFCNFDEHSVKQYELKSWFTRIAAEEASESDFFDEIAQLITESFRNDEIDFDEQFQNNVAWMEEAYEHAYEAVTPDE